MRLKNFGLFAGNLARMTNLRSGHKKCESCLNGPVSVSVVGIFEPNEEKDVVVVAYCVKNLP
jgi:hypothetical protein